MPWAVMGSPKSPTETEFELAISYRMREARDRLHGMTQEKMGMILGTTQPTYQKWEDRGNIPLAYVLRFCYAVHIDPIEFLSPNRASEDAKRRAAGVGRRKAQSTKRPASDPVGAASKKAERQDAA